MTTLSPALAKPQAQSLPRRNFTEPPPSRLQRGPTHAAEEEAERTLFRHPNARFYSFQTPGPPRPTSSTTTSPGKPANQLKWKSETEHFDGFGLRLYLGRAQYGLLEIANKSFALTMMPNSLWWCVDKKSIFATQRGNKVYRIELPFNTDEDKAMVQGFRAALSELVPLDRGPCPFDPESNLDLLQDGKKIRKLFGRSSEANVIHDRIDYNMRKGLSRRSVDQANRGSDSSDGLDNQDDDTESLSEDPEPLVQKFMPKTRATAEGQIRSFTVPAFSNQEMSGERRHVLQASNHDPQDSHDTPRPESLSSLSITKPHLELSQSGTSSPRETVEEASCGNSSAQNVFTHAAGQVVAAPPAVIRDFGAGQPELSAVEAIIMQNPAEASRKPEPVLFSLNLASASPVVTDLIPTAAPTTLSAAKDTLEHDGLQFSRAPSDALPLGSVQSVFLPSESPSLESLTPKPLPFETLPFEPLAPASLASGPQKFDLPSSTTSPSAGHLSDSLTANDLPSDDLRSETPQYAVSYLQTIQIEPTKCETSGPRVSTASPKTPKSKVTRRVVKPQTSFIHRTPNQDADDIPAFGIVSQTLGILLGPPSGLIAILSGLVRRIGSYHLTSGIVNRLDDGAGGGVVWKAPMMPGRWQEDSEDEIDDVDGAETEDDYGVPLGNGSIGRQRRKIWGSASKESAPDAARQL